MLDKEDIERFGKINDCLDRIDALIDEIKAKADKEKEEKRKILTFHYYLRLGLPFKN